MYRKTRYGAMWPLLLKTRAGFENIQFWHESLKGVFIFIVVVSVSCYFFPMYKVGTIQNCIPDGEEQ